MRTIRVYVALLVAFGLGLGVSKFCAWLLSIVKINRANIMNDEMVLVLSDIIFLMINEQKFECGMYLY